MIVDSEAGFRLAMRDVAALCRVVRAIDSSLKLPE